MHSIHILRAGRFPQGGGTVELSEKDLDAVAANYDPARHEAPIVIGHPRHDSPAFGWIGSLARTPDGVRATPARVDAQFAEMVRDKRFTKVSASLYGPTNPHNPTQGAWSLRHVGFLGAQPPVIKGLDAVQLSEDDGEVATVELDVAEFAEDASTMAGIARSFADLFRRLRDHLIDSSSLESADRAIPDWLIKDVSDQADEIERANEQPTPDEPKEANMAEPDAELAEREQKINEREAAQAEREKALAEREQGAARAAAAEFAEKLADEGRILPRDAAPIAELLSSLPEGDTVEFAEDDGGKARPVPTADYLRSFLGRLPTQVDFSERAAGAPDNAPAVGMVVPDGFSVDPASADLHKRTVQFSEANNVSYDEALTVVSQQGG